MDDIERLCNLAGPPQNGRRSLIGRKYSNENFERLLFGPGDPFSGGVEIRDCEFVACSTDSTFSISQGVHMQSVLFDGVRSPDAMMVSSASVLENIVVRGGKRSHVYGASRQAKVMSVRLFYSGRRLGWLTSNWRLICRNLQRRIA